MIDRLVAFIVMTILAGAFLWQDLPHYAAAIEALALLYLWKGSR